MIGKLDLVPQNEFWSHEACGINEWHQSGVRVGCTELWPPFVRRTPFNFVYGRPA